jgi:phage terminase small subunit
MKSLQAIHDAQIEKDPRTAIAAIQEANRMDGSHAAQKHQHAGAIGTYDLSKMSDDELDRLEAILGPLALAGGDPSGEGEA